jgi:hypothetical protein
MPVKIDSSQTPATTPSEYTPTINSLSSQQQQQQQHSSTNRKAAQQPSIFSSIKDIKLKDINWLHASLLIGTPIIGFTGALFTPLQYKTLVLAVIYYFITAFGITGGEFGNKKLQFIIYYYYYYFASFIFFFFFFFWPCRHAKLLHVSTLFSCFWSSGQVSLFFFYNFFNPWAFGVYPDDFPFFFF